MCLPTCSEVSRPLASTCGSSPIFELRREKQVCRDHLASEEVYEGIQIHQTLVVRVRFVRLLRCMIDAIGNVTLKRQPLTASVRHEVVLRPCGKKSVAHANTCSDRALRHSLVFSQFKWRELRFYCIGPACKAVRDWSNIFRLLYNFCSITLQIQYCCKLNFR